MILSERYKMIFSLSDERFKPTEIFRLYRGKRKSCGLCKDLLISTNPEGTPSRFTPKKTIYRNALFLIERDRGFESSGGFVIGHHLEIVISWPVLLETGMIDGALPLKLILRGRAEKISITDVVEIKMEVADYEYKITRRKLAV
jgi:hypothetical protein